MATLKPLWSALGEIASRLVSVTNLHLATDYDGTLTPIADHPEGVRIPDRTREALDRLTHRPKARLAVLSGRTIDDLERHLRLPRVFLSGTSGLETRAVDGGRETHAGPDDAIPPELSRDLEAWCQRFPGAWLEDKRVAFSLHYRRVAADLQPAFGAGVRRRIRPLAKTVELVHGKRAFEVRPRSAADKAAALDRWLEGRDPGLLIFIGDDTLDEPVHARVRERGGFAAAVGRTVSRAEYVLPSTTEVTWFLEWLDRECATRQAPVETRIEEPALA